MKFQVKDEMDTFSFEDAVIEKLEVKENEIIFGFNGALVKENNSQNARFQDMYCGAMELTLEGAKIARFVKEGMKYYDADGNLLNEIPNEDVPAPAQPAILERLAKGTVFTTVKDEVETGYAYEFGIDVPCTDDEEEVDTFWLCITFSHAIAGWERYCSPVE